MRNSSIDSLKAVAAYFVIFIHFSFPGWFGEAADAAARTAVPVFFLVSGYFCCPKDSEPNVSKIPGKAAHILKLMLVAYSFYFLWESFWKIQGGGAMDYWETCFSMKAVSNFLLYNFSPVKSHLWFLPALLYCYLLWYMAEKWKKERAAYFLIPLLLFLHLYLEEFSSFSGFALKRYQVRNFLLTGLPFFAMGHWIRRYQIRLKTMLPGTFYLTAGTAGTLLAVFERFWWGQKELFTGNILAAFAFFFLAAGAEGQTPLKKRLGYVGCRYSLHLYLWHPAVGKLVQFLAELLNISEKGVYHWMKPLLICILTTGLAALMVQICQKRKART